MTVNLAPYGVQQFLDANGDPYNGGKLYTYAAGTSTPKAAYTDSGGLTAHANPIVLDSSGRAEFWLDTSAPYKLVLRTSADVEVWTVDDVNAGIQGSLTTANVPDDLIRASKLDDSTDARANEFATAIKFLGTGTGAQYRTLQDRLRDSVCAFDFMTTAQIADVRAGTYSVDVTAAVQAAIDAGNTATRAVYFPSGQYLVGNIDLYSSSRLIGEGRHTTIFRCKTGTTGIWIEADNASKLTITDMAFFGQNVTGLTHIAKFGATTQFGTEGNLSRLWFRDGPATAYGLWLNANVGLFSDITVQGVGYGIYNIGSFNMGQNLVIVDTDVIGLYASSGFYKNVEVEAPISGSQPVYVFREAHIDGLTVSLANGTSFTSLIEADSAIGNEWSVTGLLISYGTATATSVFKQASSTWNGVEGHNIGLGYVRDLTMGGPVKVARSSPTYSSSITIDSTLGDSVTITATNTTAFTINAPTGPVAGQRMSIRIKNGSGGVLGTVSWDAVFKMASWTSPANGFSRTITFEYDGTNWVEMHRTASDVAN